MLRSCSRPVVKLPHSDIGKTERPLLVWHTATRGIGEPTSSGGGTVACRAAFEEKSSRLRLGLVSVGAGQASAHCAQA
jgi:hypothetical protein